MTEPEEQASDLTDEKGTLALKNTQHLSTN